VVGIQCGEYLAEDISETAYIKIQMKGIIKVDKRFDKRNTIFNIGFNLN